MPDTKMSDDELVGLTRAYLTRRRATPPARDLEENIIRSALARRGTRRLGTVLGVAAVVTISALAGAGVLYLHAGSSGWHVAEDSSGAGVYAISCVSSGDCWAVGTAIEHESDGSGWSVVSDRLPSGGSLNAVACVSGDVCWAVGAVDDGNHSQLLIEHRMGGKWAIVRAPAMSTAPGASPGLSSVTCVSANDCWAVGSAATEGGPAVQPLIAHYAGSGWSLVNGPHITGSGGELSAVTCVNADDCWAVGPGSLIEHYLGGSWVVETGQRVEGTLSAVTCVAADSCWAVGSTGAGDTEQPLVERYSAAGWAVVPSPHISVPNGGELAGVACVSGNECWAVGDLPGIGVLLPQTLPNTADSWPSTQPLIERYSGGRWTIVAGIASAQGSGLTGIACDSSGACWSVGGTLRASTS
ncbi:MAG: hypothetical protein WAW53_12980 [Candidatus Dormiibacterota bacterium]